MESRSIFNSEMHFIMHLRCIIFKDLFLIITIKQVSQNCLHFIWLKPHLLLATFLLIFQWLSSLTMCLLQLLSSWMMKDDEEEGWNIWRGKLGKNVVKCALATLTAWCLLKYLARWHSVKPLSGVIIHTESQVHQSGSSWCKHASYILVPMSATDTKPCWRNGRVCSVYWNTHFT